MTPFQELVAAQTTYGHRPSMLGQFYATVGVIVLIVVVAVMAVTFGPGAAAQPAERTTTTEVTDGWMSAITYANRQRVAAETVDGWASALLKPELLVVDGWASRYLVAEDD